RAGRRAIGLEGLSLVLLLPRARDAESGRLARQLGAEPRDGGPSTLPRLDRQVAARSPEADAWHEDADVLRRPERPRRAARHPRRQRRRADPGAPRLGDLARRPTGADAAAGADGGSGPGRRRRHSVTSTHTERGRDA